MRVLVQRFLKAAQLGLFSGPHVRETPSHAAGATAKTHVHAHVAKNPHGGGVHVVQEHERAYTPAAPEPPLEVAAAVAKLQEERRQRETAEHPVAIGKRLAAEFLAGPGKGIDPVAEPEEWRHALTVWGANQKVYAAADAGGRPDSFRRDEARNTFLRVIRGGQVADPSPKKPAFQPSTAADARMVEVPISRKADFEKAFKALQKRAEKLGVTPPSFRYTGAQRIETYHHTEGRETFEIGKEPILQVELTGPTIQAQGPWKLVGVSEPTKEGPKINLFGQARGTENEIPPRIAQGSDSCDHCRSKRKRTQLLLLRNEETGEWKQVGKECSKDYTGREAEDAVGISRLLLDFYADWNMKDGGRAVSHLDPASILACAAWETEENGYVSKANTAPGSFSTSQRVENHLREFHKDEGRSGKAVPWLQERFRQKAKKVLSWVHGLEKGQPGSYLENLRVIGQKPVIGWDDVGMLASAVKGYDTAMARKEEERQRSLASTHFGSVGDVIRAVPLDAKEAKAWAKKGQGWHGARMVTVVRTHTVEGELERGGYRVPYSTTYVTLRDDEGHLFEWPASNRSAVDVQFPPYSDDKDRWETGWYDMEPGKRFVLLGGRIKEHTEFRGEKRTKLSHVSLSPDPANYEGFEGFLDAGHGAWPDEASTAAWKHLQDLRAMAKARRRRVRLVVRRKA